ncbi:hypothetical protein OK7_05624 [Enterococcus faecium EnGen0024]|uniref:Phage protein n=1 Tax=Enterococcus faecium 10/96A TaxID=1391465 RepID=A0AAV3KX49_ENTFC|nr:DUF1642 domain-containing protein [Enterococcus faecium]ELB34951.1 hypothetical protein OK7_05624 [Enterococcus faecium EnGen0024]ERT44393.1 hypothetical protein O991_03429 [Enterococcus faecium 10/96A]
MNKQKLIDKYTAEIAKLRPYCPNRNQSEEKLKLGIFTEFIADLKQLDESHKKIIPKCAHKFIQEGIDSGSDYFTIIICADSFANAKPQDEFSKWLRENSGLFIRSLLNGYEVEKVPKYIVKIGKLYLKEPLGDTSNSTILTTWDKKRAYPFSSFNMADKHADKFEGAVVEEAEG